jgi:hypothetical protein
MKKPVIDIGVACAANQTPTWWTPIMGGLLAEQKLGVIDIHAIISISSALPDHNKNVTIEKYNTTVQRMKKTDVNRNKVSEDFLSGPADYLFFIDDDTVFQNGTITKLVEQRRDFVAGIYFMPGPKNNHPIAYRKIDGGFYTPIVFYPDGGLIQVDSVGMGCTLIHRSVFEKIKEGHKLFVRPNGSFAVVQKKQILNKKPYKGKDRTPYVKDGILHTPVVTVEPDDNRGFPFFAMEYCRTEDHHFCELAANVGIRPWIDTTLDCLHVKTKGTTVADYRDSLARGDFHESA